MTILYVDTSALLKRVVAEPESSAVRALLRESNAAGDWFMRLPSNATGSEPNQSGNGGRYTFMGDLNPFPGFRAPATGC